jgi:BASS family bile acid:Na+ symporter
MSLTELILLVLKTSIALSVLALGLKATFSDAIYLFRYPHHLVRAFLSMNVLMPSLAWILSLTFDLNPAVKIALGALSVSPVPPIFPKKALKAGGKENYAVGLLVAAALLAIVVVPITIEIFEKTVGLPLQMPARDVATLVFKTVLAPLLAGIVLRRLAPPLAARTAEPLGTLASVLLILSVLPVLFGSSRAMLSLVGNGTLASLSAFAVAGFIIGHLLGGPGPDNRQVLSLATATRHPGMAAAIAQANFPGQTLVVPAIALYLIVSGILAALLLALRTRSEKTSETDKQRAA